MASAKSMIKKDHFGIRRNVKPDTNPLAALFSAWHHKVLISRLTRREIEARYRGSSLGVVWAIATPLIMLAVYSFVFGTVMPAHWELPNNIRGNYTLIFFSGLIVFNFFSEVIIRSPNLMLENPAYIKKVLFPLDVLVWTNICTALFNLSIGLVLLFGFYFLFLGLPPVSIILTPITLLPLILTGLGLSWILASLGVFIRDIRLFIAVIINMFLFLSPVFYPLSAAPPNFRFLIMLNPITPAIESLRAVIFFGILPDLRVWSVSLIVGICINWLGYIWFKSTQKGFADVL